MLIGVNTMYSAGPDQLEGLIGSLQVMSHNLIEGSHPSPPLTFAFFHLNPTSRKASHSIL